MSLLVIVALVAAACAAAPPAPPQVWIDSPADGATVRPGAPVPVVCRALSSKDVAEVLLTVNGAPYRSRSGEGSATSPITLDWLPTEPGHYALQVTARDTAGAESAPQTVIVKVESAPSPPPPAATPSPSATATTAAAVETTPTQAPTPSPTTQPSATPSATPTPPAEVTLTVERATIDAGQCTVLHWAVEHATAVYLNGEGVVGNGSREVCPSGTTTYSLHVEAAGGNVDRSVTVTVLPDETPPPVPRLESPEAGATVTTTNCNCPGTVVLDWSPVTDPSGVVYQVRVRVKDGAIWRTVGEWDTAATALKVQLDCRRSYQCGVRALDGAGNSSNWAQADFGVRTCA